MATTLTDFTGETNGDIDASAAWTRGRQVGFWTNNIVTDAGNTPSGKSLQFNENGWGTQGNNTAANNALGAVTGQLDVVLQMQTNVALTSVDYPIGIFLLDGTGFVANNNTSITNPQQGYGMAFKGTGSWQCGRYDTSGVLVASGIGANSANILTPTINTDFWMRITRTSGNVIKGKVWGTSYASEPGSYTVNTGLVTDTGITTLLAACVSQSSTYILTIRKFAASTDGDGTASLGAGGSSIAAISAYYNSIRSAG